MEILSQSLVSPRKTGNGVPFLVDVWGRYNAPGKESHIPNQVREVREKKHDIQKCLGFHWLVVSTHLKNMLVKMGIFPK